MAGNSFGRVFTVTSFGESHGPAIGCVVDGCPPGLALSVDDIQRDLDRRKPGTSRHVTQRQESDTVEILSGLFEGKTTGTPIALLIRNEDARSRDYGNLIDTSVPVTQTTPIGRSMEFVTIEAGVEPLRVKRLCESRQRRSRENGSGRSMVW